MIRALKGWKYILKLVVETPRYQLIIFMSLISGGMSFLGFPLMVPVLEYLRSDGATGGSSAILRVASEVFSSLGFNPGFYPFLIVACILILLGELAVNLTTLVALYASYDLIKQYSKRLFELYLKVDWRWLTATNSGEINYVILRESEQAAASHLCAARFVISLIQCVVYIILAVLMSAKSVLMAVFVYGLLMVINIHNARKVRDISSRINRSFMNASSVLNSFQRNKKFLKTSLLNQNIIEKIISRIDQINEGHKGVGTRLQIQKGCNFAVMFVYLVLLIVFRNFMGLEYASLVVLVLVFSRLSPQFSLVSDNYTQLNRHLPMYKSLTARLDQMEENLEKNGIKIFDGKGAIRFADVGFAYPNGYQVFHHLNLTIEARSAVAIVGRSGTGKTTALDLLLGLLKPDSGKIYYGDVAHDELDLNSLRKHVAYISQEPTLLDGTLRENLTIAYPTAPEEMIWDVCRKVHLDQFIKSLPDGLDTVVGENGTKLSGGQRQRVVLGRALFTNPKILILDEATSELDSESERMIQQTIKELSHELTIVIVAHRLSTVKFVDCVYVLEQGAVVEAGSYRELLEKKGRLYQLEALQK